MIKIMGLLENTSTPWYGQVQANSRILFKHVYNKNGNDNDNDNEDIFITIDFHIYKTQDGRYKYTEEKASNIVLSLLIVPMVKGARNLSLWAPISVIQ